MLLKTMHKSGVTMQQIALDLSVPALPSLDRFVVGDNAAMQAALHAALDGLRQSPSTPPVTLYLWGDTAVGKTYLLTAAALAAQQDGLAVGCMSAHNLSLQDYDSAWRLVVLDDVHLYNTAQQQQAFNWLIHAQAHGVQVLAAGNAAPAALAVRDDVRTRIGWGLVFWLQAPDEATLVHILQQEATQRGLSLSDEVTHFLLTRFDRNLSSLLRLLNDIDRYAWQSKRHITIAMIKDMLAQQEVIK